MPTFQNTFDGGTNGSTITEVNSGGASGTPFTLVEIITGATCIYSSAAAKHNTRGCRITGNGAHAFLQHDIEANTKLSTRFYISIPSATTVNCQVYTPRSVVNYIGGVNITTAMKFQVTNVAGTPVFTSATLSTATYYRVEISHEVLTSTTGKIQFKYFVGDSTTAVESFTSTTADLGTSPIVMYRLGKINNGGSTPVDLDSITFNVGSTVLLGPHVDLNIPPLANAGAGGNDIEPGTTFTLVGSASTDPDGSIASYLWEQTAGQTVALSGSGSNRTFDAPYTISGGVLGFKLTVTDNAGATSSAASSVTVLPATERAAVNGVWVAARVELIVNEGLPPPGGGFTLFPAITLFPGTNLFPD